MVVVVTSWRLSLPGCRSLKEKRRVVKSLKDRLRSRFNVSVTETGSQDVWNLAELTVALVATDRRFADSVLSKVDNMISGDSRTVVLDSTRTLY